MKTFHSLPNNNDFFNRYATLTPTLYKLGFFAQLVSAFTEIGVIYSLVFSSLSDFWPKYATVAATGAAFIGTAFLEIGLRKFLPYSCQAILYRRFSGLDALMSVFILGATVALLAASGALSFAGSKEMVKAVAPTAEQRTTGGADTAYHAGRAIALSTYRADSAEIVTRYDNQATAITTAYKSQIGATTEQRDNLKAKERADGKSYATAKADLRLKVKDLEAERDAKLAALTADKGRELSEAATGRKTALEGLESDYSAAKSTISAFNAGAVAKVENQVSAYGGGLAWFTIVCLFVLIVSVFLNEAHRKGSGIEEKVIPSQYDFSAPVTADLMNATGNKLQQWLRAGIRRIEESTPPPPLPLAPNELYSLENLQQPVFRVNFDEIPEAYKDVRIEARPAPMARPSRWKQPKDSAGSNAGSATDGAPALAYLQAARTFADMGHPDLARDQELRADQVLTMYLGPSATRAAVADLKAACIAFLDGRGPNPFEQHHRRNIGFTMPTGAPQEPTAPPKTQGGNIDALTQCVKQEPTGSAKTQKTGNCAHCGNAFQKRTTWQKYCSESCRRDNHATRHGGTAFDPNFKPWSG